MLTYVGEDLYECNYCLKVYDGFAQCSCYGFGNDTDSESAENVCTLIFLF